MSSDPQASAPLILAVDPGNEFSAYVIVENDLSRVVDKGKVENGVLLRKIEDEFLSLPIEYAAIEMVACYGMPVGREVFETCVNIGRLMDGVLLRKIEDEFLSLPIEYAAIEMVACYGMPVGREVFETCVNIGRLMDRIEKVLHLKPTWIYRKDEKICLCNSMRAKDSNIRQALIDGEGFQHPAGID